MNLERDAECRMGDHNGPNCGNCGHVNYRWLGYLGAVASAAKRWGLTKDEAEDRMTRRAIEAAIKSGEIEGTVEDYL